MSTKATHHFFGTSFARWRKNPSLDGAIGDMKPDKEPFSVWMVPGPVSAVYDVIYFVPQVEGAILLSCYERTPKLGRNGRPTDRNTWKDAPHEL
jgi:hypothetical protein